MYEKPKITKLNVSISCAGGAPAVGTTTLSVTTSLLLR